MSAVIRLDQAAPELVPPLHPVLTRARLHAAGPMPGPGIYAYVEGAVIGRTGLLKAGTPRYIGDTGGGMRWRGQFDVARRHGTDPLAPVPVGSGGRPRYRNVAWKAYLARAMLGQGTLIEVFTILVDEAEGALAKVIERRLIAEIGRQPAGPLMNGCGGGGGDYGAARAGGWRGLDPGLVAKRLAALGFKPEGVS